MSKQLIQSAGVLFMLATLLAVSAQESTTTSNNATMNNTALLNNTTLNASLNETFNATTSNETVVVVQNETYPAQNFTMPENITAIVEPVSKASQMLTISRPQVAQIGSPQMAVFAIGRGERTPPLFSIDGKALPKRLTKSACQPRR